jgi:hypothetical protein
MLVRAYLPPIMTALFGGLFIAAGILTFGNAAIFDRLFIGILVFTAVTCRKNVNILSVVAIILLQRALEECAWSFLTDTYLIKIALYSFGFWLVYYLRHDWITRVLLTSLILVSVAEIYWYINDDLAPQVYWNIGLMIFDVIIRYLIFSRFSFVELWFKGRAVSINLDWTIYKLSAIAIIVQCAIITEYLIRHILELPNLLLVYSAYPYAMHIIATIAIWATFHESYKQIAPKLLKA